MGGLVGWLLRMEGARASGRAEVYGEAGKGRGLAGCGRGRQLLCQGNPRSTSAAFSSLRAYT